MSKVMTRQEAISFLVAGGVEPTDTLLAELTCLKYIMCRKCMITKPYTRFHKDKKSKTGRRVSCKSCTHQTYPKKQKRATMGDFGCIVTQTPSKILAHQQQKYGDKQYASVKIKMSPMRRPAPWS